MGIEDLYDKYEQALIRFARSIAMSRDEADDLVQETLIRAISNINLIGTLPDYQVKSWLFKVLKNCMIDKRRREQHEVLTELEIEQQYERSVETDVESKILTQEALSYLSEKDRDIVFKRYWLDMTSSEIAKSFSIPAATVRYRLHTAINLLKNKYKVI